MRGYNRTMQTLRSMRLFSLLSVNFVNDLVSDPDFNANASAEVNINKSFGLDDITYESEVVLNRIFHYLNETNFLGITGSISFDEDGIRDGSRLFIYQNRYINGSISSVKIGDVVGDELNFVYVDTENNSSVWPEGAPNDGVPINRITTVHLSITIIFGVLSASGLVFCFICVIFNLIFRNTTLIRLTSPNLNYVILAGAALLYVDIYFITLPKGNETFATVSCHITVLLTAFGYSLCFGTIMAKMMRIYYIFNNPLNQKPSVLIVKDLPLFVFVCCLVGADILLLVIYIVTDRNDLKASMKMNAENPSDLVRDPNGIYYEVIFDNYIYICTSVGRSVLLGVLYGYKAVLQVLTVLLALKTRKVKVKGLDDYKYIIMATYVSTFVLVLVIVFTFTIEDHVNLYAALTSFSFFLGSTVIVMLVFVPKMLTLYRDPEGEQVFSKTVPRENAGNDLPRYRSGSEDPTSINAVQNNSLQPSMNGRTMSNS